MVSDKKRRIIFIFLLVILFSAPFAFSQFEPDTQSQHQVEDLDIKSSYFEKVPTSYWFKITAIGTFSIIIVVVAFIFGFVSYFMGWNAGGKENKRKIYLSILAGVVIGILARPISIKVNYYLAMGLCKFLPDPLGQSIAGFIIYVLWITYVAAIPVCLYEVFVVTTKEAYPVQR